MDKFGKLRTINPRDIWNNEAKDFTPWLAQNIDELGKSLGMQLELQKQEAGVGDFSLDLLAVDIGRNRNVIIENQLNPTDHDHLGKLLTYASGFDASVIIWIAESIREEHRQSLDWLNQRTDSDTEFFGIVIEILQIDDSKPAYNFKPVVFPNEWQKSKKHPKTQVSEKMELYRQYFQALIDELREKHRFTNARKGQPQSWYSFASGYSGVTYAMCFALGERARVELYIDQGDTEINKALFDLIHKDKIIIENEISEKLKWERLDGKQACRVSLGRNGSIENNNEQLIEIRNWSIEKLLLFKKVFDPKLKQYLTEIKANS